VSFSGLMEGSTVLVTGAGQGMGRSHALALARLGAIVGVLDNEAEPATVTCSMIEDGGGKAVLLIADVSDREAVQASVSELVARCGGLDAIVSNAGTIHANTGLLETEDADWNRTLTVHVSGTLNVIRAGMPALLDSANPRVVIVSSMWAQRGPGFGYAYCAAKGALLAFARNLAVEFGSRGVCVNAIAPGSVPTRMAADYGPAEIARDSEDIPLGRWGRAEEISDLVCFLVSSASYITGQTIAINGGQIIAGF
jgi:NAD(P)-dependent dehydrogenase (short-subunit alcohol dehydrogenase family)